MIDRPLRTPRVVLAVASHDCRRARFLIKQAYPFTDSLLLYGTIKGFKSIVSAKADFV